MNQHEVASSICRSNQRNDTEALNQLKCEGYRISKPQSKTNRIGTFKAPEMSTDGRQNCHYKFKFGFGSRDMLKNHFFITSSRDFIASFSLNFVSFAPVACLSFSRQVLCHTMAVTLEAIVPKHLRVFMSCALQASFAVK